MARPREFDELASLDAAITLFCDHGYEGTTTEMLVQALGVGRQSLYNSFGDKWQLYCAALSRYCTRETAAHIARLSSHPRAIDGIEAMVRRLVVEEAKIGCLGTSSACEFGARKSDLVQIWASHDRLFRAALSDRVREGQSDGDISQDLDPDSFVDFVTANFSGIRIAARAGLPAERVKALGDLILRCLR